MSVEFNNAWRGSRFRSGSISVKWSGNGLRLLAQAVDALGDTRGTRAYGRAVDHTGRKVYTQVRRALAKQVGLPVGKAESVGRLKKRATYGSEPGFEIQSSGRPLSLQANYRTRATRTGVRASSPYGKSSLYRSAFFVPRWSNDVFWRTSDARFPVQRVGGPHIPREMVRYNTREMFQTFVSTHLPQRVAHEIRAITRGAVS